MKRGRIAASVLSADFGRLGDEVRAVEEAGVDWIHLDVMDGHFVPNITIGPMVVESVREVTTLPLDVHLMIQHPEDFVEEFAKAGAQYITVHQEACPHLHAVIEQIRAAGAQPGVVINPGTPISVVEPVLGDIELLLIMSVNPGFGGQKFIQSSGPKLTAARRLRDERGLSFLIEVDGGVKVDNAKRVAEAGAEVLVVGSGLFKTSDYKATVALIRREIDDGLGG